MTRVRHHRDLSRKQFEVIDKDYAYLSTRRIARVLGIPYGNKEAKKQQKHWTGLQEGKRIPVITRAQKVQS